MQDLRFAWLEVTSRCSLLCDHCYANSGPTPGRRARTERCCRRIWLRVIDEVAQLGGWMVSSLRAITDGKIFATTRMRLQHNFSKRQRGPDNQKCAPESRCNPSQSDCKPHCPPGYHCGPKCTPEQCWPGYYCAPDGWRRTHFEVQDVYIDTRRDRYGYGHQRGQRAVS